MSEFNPNAEVHMVSSDGTERIVVDYGWDGVDKGGPRNIEQEKYETKSVDLFTLTELELKEHSIRLKEALHDSSHGNQCQGQEPNKEGINNF